MLLLYAWLLSKSGKTEKAMDALRSASEREPRNPDPWKMMAELHASLGSAESAARCRSQAAALQKAAKAPKAPPRATPKPDPSAARASPSGAKARKPRHNPR
jgi:predicted Zn-dependent protease